MELRVTGPSGGRFLSLAAPRRRRAERRRRGRRMSGPLVSVPRRCGAALSLRPRAFRISPCVCWLAGVSLMPPFAHRKAALPPAGGKRAARKVAVFSRARRRASEIVAPPAESTSRLTLPRRLSQTDAGMDLKCRRNWPCSLTPSLPSAQRRGALNDQSPPPRRSPRTHDAMLRTSGLCLLRSPRLSRSPHRPPLRCHTGRLAPAEHTSRSQIAPQPRRRSFAKPEHP